ncbi:hypothetical protein [Streptomyces sp. NPDC003023]|uniref:hypothetical protein n=1 Tax=Streptomyces sp. NPDC003023 TaxID=3364675 RepID=UPI00368E7CBC
MTKWTGIRDEQAFREAARRVVDLVLTDDDVYLDALPDAVEIEIVTPLSMVADVLEDGHTLDELRSAVRVFLSAAAAVASQMPNDLAEMVSDLRTAR